MSVVEKIKNCAGCFACFNICPNNNIKMTLNEEGFYVPKSSYNCNLCSFCEEVCPILNIPKIQRYEKPIAYASWSKDDKIRLDSSSGGVFTELAKIFLENDGVVYGVSLDEDLSANHLRIRDNEGLEKLRGSKYIQSYVNDAFKNVERDLKDKRLVLFSGTPCQIAGLNNFIKKEFKNLPKNLLTVDLVCHGIPSLKIFKMYLEHISGGRKIKSIDFRNKEIGWTKFMIKIFFDNGTEYKSIHKEDPFFKAFLMNLCLNVVCYECPFSKIPRQGDLTLGDFWGVPNDLKSEKGVSVVLLNSEKGKEFFKDIKNLEKIEIPLKLAVKNNPRIYSGKLKIPKERSKILNSKNFEEILGLLKRKSKRKIFI